MFVPSFLVAIATVPSLVSALAIPSVTATVNATTSVGVSTGVCYGGAAPKSTIVASNGDVYGVCAGNDFYGYDLPLPNTKTSAKGDKECANECSKTTGCIAAAYTGGTCWLKGSRNDASVNKNVDGLYLLLSPSEPTKATGVCYGGAAPKSIKTASNGDFYGICPKNDFHGGDFPNQPVRKVKDMTACYELCSKKSGCVAVAYEGTDCYLKSSRKPASIVSFVDAAYKLDGTITLGS